MKTDLQSKFFQQRVTVSGQGLTEQREGFCHSYTSNQIFVKFDDGTSDFVDPETARVLTEQAEFLPILNQVPTNPQAIKKMKDRYQAQPTYQCKKP